MFLCTRGIFFTWKSARDLFQGLFNILLVFGAMPQKLTLSFYFEFTILINNRITNSKCFFIWIFFIQIFSSSQFLFLYADLNFSLLTFRSISNLWMNILSSYVFTFIQYLNQSINVMQVTWTLCSTSVTSLCLRLTKLHHLCALLWVTPRILVMENLWFVCLKFLCKAHSLCIMYLLITHKRMMRGLGWSFELLIHVLKTCQICS